MSARLFAALSLPSDVRAALSAWGRSCAREGLRHVPADNLHVTLVFLGDQPEPEAVARAFRAAVAGGGAGDGPAARRGDPATGRDDRPAGEGAPLAVTAVAWLPPRRPGVLVADLAASARILSLQSALAAALAPFREPERRPFRPHVTVGRVRRGARIATGGLPPPPALRFAPERLVLYESRAGRHESVVEVPATG